MDNSHTEPQKENSASAGPGAPRRKIKLTKTLPTDRIAFNKQLDAIIAIPVAYEKANGPVSFSEVAGVMGMAETTLLQASAFLNDVGIIHRVEGGKFIPSSEVQEFYRMHGIAPDKAWAKLTPLFERSWFGKELIPRLKLRGAMEEVEAKEVLAEVANAEKSHLEQLKIAIDFLQKVGVLIRDGGQIRLASSATLSEPEGNQKNSIASIPITPPLVLPADPTMEQHSITLDASKGRKVIISTPPNVTRRELERIQKWLEFQLIVDDDGNQNGGAL
jgi:hypothetical protein